MTDFYPEIEPHEHGMLEVGDGNLVYWETCGNPRGKPAENAILSSFGAKYPISRSAFALFPCRGETALLYSRRQKLKAGGG